MPSFLESKGEGWVGEGRRERRSVNKGVKFDSGADGIRGWRGGCWFVDDEVEEEESSSWMSLSAAARAVGEAGRSMSGLLSLVSFYCCCASRGRGAEGE